MLKHKFILLHDRHITTVATFLLAIIPHKKTLFFEINALPRFFPGSLSFSVNTGNFSCSKNGMYEFTFNAYSCFWVLLSITRL